MYSHLKKNYLKIFITALTGLFILQSAYFIFHTERGIPPDEIEHLKQIVSYYETPTFFLSAEDLRSDYGTVHQRGFLYYLLLGKASNLNIFDIPHYIFMRIINLGFSLLYLLAFYKLLQLFFERKKWLIITAFAIQTNILMFTFLSSSVNYDNLLNLLAVSSIYFVFKHFKTESIHELMLGFIAIGLGMLTKISFGPLMVLLFITIAIKHWRKPKAFFQKSWNYLTNKQHLKITLSLLFIFIINLMLFGGNYIKYGAFVPKCPQIYSAEQCSSESSGYTLYHIPTEQAFTPIGPYAYIKQWSALMLQRTIGIFAHQSMEPPRNIRDMLSVLAFAFILLFIKGYDRKNALINLAIGISLAYGLFLAFYANYPAYKINGIIHAGVQGRYIFPVLSLLIIIFTNFMLNSFKPTLQKIVSILIIAFFLYAGFPSYYHYENRAIFENKPQAVTN